MILSKLKSAAKLITRVYGTIATIPFRAIKPNIKPPDRVQHSNWKKFLPEQFNKKGCRVLEIGSRNVTGVNLRARFQDAEYVGFDFYPGENVDVTGDAHKLSSYFSEDEKFDLIFSSAVFEHLHMPWVAATEIQKMLKPGGFVFVETHFSFSSHERPWHFFQFSDMGLRALFNSALGFRLIDSGMSNPIGGYFTHNADSYLRYRVVTELYCHSEIFCQKVEELKPFDWREISIDQIAEGTRYPFPVSTYSTND